MDRKFAIMAARAKTGKQQHQRTIVTAPSAPKALRKGYGCNVQGSKRSIVTKRGWKIWAEPVA